MGSIIHVFYFSLSRLDTFISIRLETEGGAVGVVIFDHTGNEG